MCPVSKLPPHLAHELRGPLHLILGYTRLLAKEAEGEVAAKLAIIEKNGEKLMRLIEVAPSASQSDLASDAPVFQPQQDKRPRTLLVVDDIKENGDLLCDLCSMWGYRVIQATNGAEALAICLQTDSVIDAVLLDQFMPVLDGWGFLQAVRADNALADLPVILISAAAAQRPLTAPAELVFSRVIAKPLDAQQLADYLRQMFGEQRSGENALPVVLTTENIETFRAMLDLGQVVAIRRWVEALALTRPECVGFANQVKRCCLGVDLAGLRHLLEQATSSAQKVLQENDS